ncbi:MAG TPA: OmpA family protein [Polyangia bacterium]|jgi:peptidoglycan-associated lipoprotein
MRFSHLWPAAIVCLFLATGCPPKYPKCSGDKDCHEKEYCVNGTCQQCRSDGDCPGGKCNAGRCESAPPPSMSCTDDRQCPAGQSCIDGTCKPCTSDEQCGEGGKCNAGRCTRANLPPPPNAKCTLEPVYFDFNESVLTTEATSAIDRDADCIKKNPHAVTLTGRTDPRGTEEYNLALSDKRAQSVKGRMSQLGVSSAMKINARGEMDATGKDEAGWAKDRRVDVSW